jgi:hypothetical protein
MWKPYLKVIAKKAGTALNILDRFPLRRSGLYNQAASYPEEIR